MTARLILTVVAVIFLVGWATGEVVVKADDPKPDYEAQANCIAEYDYHHYNSNMMTNLVNALEKCR